MSRFLNATMNDLRGGRETWRIYVALGGPAFILAVATAVLRMN